MWVRDGVSDVVDSGRRSATKNALFESGFMQNFPWIGFFATVEPIFGSLGLII
jgi:hypothetical protein